MTVSVCFVPVHTGKHKGKRQCNTWKINILSSALACLSLCLRSRHSSTPVLCQTFQWIDYWTMENDLARSLTLVLFGITLPYHSQTHSKRLFSIHHFHIAHDTPCLTSRSFQSIIFNFSWVNCNSQEKKWTQRLQDRAARVLTNSNYDADTSILLNDLGWQNLETQRQIQKAVMVYKSLNCLAPDYMSS